MLGTGSKKSFDRLALLLVYLHGVLKGGVLVDMRLRPSSRFLFSAFAHSLTHILFLCIYTLCMGLLSLSFIGAIALAIYPPSVACIFFVDISNSVHTLWPPGTVYSF